jgi:hypothetical protein
MSLSKTNLIAARIQQGIDSRMDQRFNRFMDITDYDRERNSRSGQYQLRGFFNNFPPYATFGSLGGSGKVGA